MEKSEALKIEAAIKNLTNTLDGFNQNTSTIKKTPGPLQVMAEEMVKLNKNLEKIVRSLEGKK